MTVKARLHQYPGKMSLSGHINTRLPVITDGLIATWPFDGTENGITNNNILYDPLVNWIPGTKGTQNGYTRIENSDDYDRIRTDILDPWDNPDIPIWEAHNTDIDSNADGGWNSIIYDIDNTKTYRFSVWIKRKGLVNGSVYLGCYGRNSTGSNIGVLTLLDAVITNIYFRSRGPAGWGDGTGLMLEDEWYLWVGHVHNYGFTGSVHTDSGIWSKDGEFIYSCIDYKWQELNAQVQHRTYLYYCTDNTTRIHWCYPRLEALDEYAPTLQDLLDGRHDLVRPTALRSDHSYSILSNGDGLALDYQSTNLIPAFKCENYCTPGSFQPGWDNDLHPKAIDDANWSVGYNSGVADEDLIYHAQYNYDPETGKELLFFRNEPGPNQVIPTWQGSAYIFSNPASSHWSIGDELSFSFDLKCDVVGGYVRAGIYHKLISTGSYSFTDSDENFYTPKAKNEWFRHTNTWTVDSDVDLTGRFQIYIYGNTPTFDCKTWVKDVQVEKLDHSTSYIGSLASRTSRGMIAYPKPKEYSIVEGTVHLRMIIPDAWYSDSTYINIFGTYTAAHAADRHLILRKNISSTKCNNMNIRNGTAWSVITTIADYYTPGEEIDFIWTWKNGGNYKFIINGVERSTGAYTTPDRDFDYFLFQHGIVLKQFSIWDKEFNGTELYILNTNAASIKSTGDIIAPKLYSKLVENEDNAWYFPLNENGKDIMETISPFSDDEDCYFGEDGYLAARYFYNYCNPDAYTFSSSYDYLTLTNFQKLNENAPVHGVELLEDGTVFITIGKTNSPDFTSEFSVSLMVWLDIPRLFDFNTLTFGSFGAQGGAGSQYIEDNGRTYFMDGNDWKGSTQTFNIGTTTSIDFDFMSTKEGEIHGIGFNEDGILNPDRIFQLYGTQTYGIQTHNDYTLADEGTWKHYSISIGSEYTGATMILVFANDHDALPQDATSRFKNITISGNGDSDELMYFFPEEYTTIEPLGVERNPLTYKEHIYAVNMPQRNWIEISKDFLNPDGGFQDVSIAYKPQKKETKIYATCPSVTLSAMSRHYTYVGRGDNALKYNLYKEGMDWSGDFTICYWKKPVGTHTTDSYIGYSLESLGGTGATYDWWGKHNGLDYVRSATYGKLTNGDFDSDDYFGKWQFVSLSKSGTTLKIQIWLQDGIQRYNDVGESVPQTDPDHYVNSYGHDLQLGGWQDTNESNAYYKDLLVCNYFLSDTDLNNIRKKKIRITKDNFLMIQDGILTGDNTL